MTIYWDIEPITYGRKIIDRGVILGRAPYKSDLSKYKTCLKADDVTADVKIHRLSQHKRGVIVYIPQCEIEEGQTIETLIGEEGHVKKQRLEVIDVSSYHVELTLIDSEQVTFSRRKPTFSEPEANENTPFDVENPFLSGSVCRREGNREIPAEITYGRKVFRKKTNFVFRYQPDAKKRTGTPFVKIPPENIVEIDGPLATVRTETGREEYLDILTGFPVFSLRKWIPERNAHLRAGGKLAPTYKPRAV